MNYLIKTSNASVLPVISRNETTGETLALKVKIGLTLYQIINVVRYIILYNNTCSSCIFISRELCVIKVHTHGWRQLMAWSNLANLFRGSSHDFCQLYYNIKQIDFIFLCFCTVIDHRWRHSVWRTKSHALDCVSCVLFCSSHAMTSSVIYYSTDARKNEIYLLNTQCFEMRCLKWVPRIILKFSQFFVSILPVCPLFFFYRTTRIR